MLKKTFGLSIVILVLGLFVSLNALASVDGKVDVVFDGSQAFQDPETGEWIQPFDIMPDGSVKLISEEEYLADFEKVVVE